MSNSFGTIFKITTWGESHGKAIGVVIDGCPSGIEISEGEITAALTRRAPGRNSYTSPRKENEHVEILSGVFEGKTTGAPVCILIPNMDVDSSKYEPIKDVLRPGHANYTYLEKYGVFDYRGGGRASGRETACRVAAGALAKKFLERNHIQVLSYVKQIGNIAMNEDPTAMNDVSRTYSLTEKSPIFCPDEVASLAMMDLIEKAKIEGNSLGGIVEFIALSVPAGLGDPVYEKLEAKLAHAMMSIPASKGFEIGSGFHSVVMSGSEHNDVFITEETEIRTKKNYAGGILGGISTGMPIVGRVAFKPTSSIQQRQETVTISGEKTSFVLPSGSRHDPCIAIRAVPVVEMMASLVIADAILVNRSARA